MNYFPQIIGPALGWEWDSENLSLWIQAHVHEHADEQLVDLKSSLAWVMCAMFRPCSSPQLTIRGTHRGNQK